MNWTEIVLGLFTLLSACGWFVSGRKHPNNYGSIPIEKCRAIVVFKDAVRL